LLAAYMQAQLVKQINKAFNKGVIYFYPASAGSARRFDTFQLQTLSIASARHTFQL